MPEVRDGCLAIVSDTVRGPVGEGSLQAVDQDPYVASVARTTDVYDSYAGPSFYFGYC